MTYVEYFGDSYFLAWCSLWLFWMIVPLVQLVAKLINRLLRSLNIWFRGWPPAHLDGDFLEETVIGGEEAEVCHNCESPMPEGCGGTFEADGDSCRLNKVGT